MTWVVVAMEEVATLEPVVVKEEEDAVKAVEKISLTTVPQIKRVSLVSMRVPSYILLHLSENRTLL